MKASVSIVCTTRSATRYSSADAITTALQMDKAAEGSDIGYGVHMLPTGNFITAKYKGEHVGYVMEPLPW